MKGKTFKGEREKREKNLTKRDLERYTNSTIKPLVSKGYQKNRETPTQILSILMTEISKTYKIKNKFGLHARPSASFVQAACRFRCNIQVEKDGQTADGKSIMDLMMLAVAKGTCITVKAQGEDAQEALDTLGILIDGQFGEE